MISGYFGYYCLVLSFVMHHLNRGNKPLHAFLERRAGGGGVDFITLGTFYKV